MEPPAASNRIEAVRIACDGQSRDDKDFKQYATYNILQTEEIYQNGELSQLSVRVGMPLLIRKVRPSVIDRGKHTEYTPGGKKKNSWSTRPNDKYHTNIIASQLMVNFTPPVTDKDTAIGAVPKGWGERVGSVLIARQDGRALHSAHIMIMLGYLTGLFEHYGDKLSAEQIFDQLSPEGFAEYYESAMGLFTLNSPMDEWAATPSPFEVAA